MGMACQTAAPCSTCSPSTSYRHSIPLTPSRLRSTTLRHRTGTAAAPATSIARPDSYTRYTTIPTNSRPTKYTLSGRHVQIHEHGAPASQRSEPHTLRRIPVESPSRRPRHVRYLPLRASILLSVPLVGLSTRTRAAPQCTQTNVRLYHVITCRPLSTRSTSRHYRGRRSSP